MSSSHTTHTTLHTQEEINVPDRGSTSNNKEQRHKQQQQQH